MKKSYSALMTSEIHEKLMEHLIRPDGQEDLCFATYLPSTGSDRQGGILQELILPEPDERNVHGNVGFLPEYVERALQFARTRNAGLAFLHSHPVEGWQGMSTDDIVAEQTRLAPCAYAITGLPLLGLTAGTDGSWSARYWLKDPTQKRTYNRFWCEAVRVVGKQLQITYNDFLHVPSFNARKQLRTISAWGKKSQEDLSRLRIGIVGLGSVGSVVAEILARTGIANIVLVDFDGVEEKNLDRLTGVFPEDIGKSKVSAIGIAIKRSATAPLVRVEEVEHSICEKEGFDSALNCDILFSCVDRPWPRQVLNFISYAHLIPVIDGGILVRTNKTNTRMLGADWKAQTVGYKRACLECLGQYKPSNAALEQAGKLDDPDYIQGIPPGNRAFFDAHENVYAFSSHLASMEVLQMLSLFLAPGGVSDVGQQMHHQVTGRMDIENKICNDNCFFPTVIGKADMAGVQVWDKHPVAEAARQGRRNKPTLKLRKTTDRSSSKKGGPNER